MKQKKKQKKRKFNIFHFMSFFFFVCVFDWLKINESDLFQSEAKDNGVGLLVLFVFSLVFFLRYSYNNNSSLLSVFDRWLWNKQYNTALIKIFKISKHATLKLAALVIFVSPVSIATLICTNNCIHYIQRLLFFVSFVSTFFNFFHFFSNASLFRV